MTPQERKRIEFRLIQNEQELAGIDKMIDIFENDGKSVAVSMRYRRAVVGRMSRLYRYVLAQDELQMRLPL